MEEPSLLSSLAFKASVTQAIFQAKSQKKLFLVYISGDNPESSNLEKSTWTDLSLAEVLSKYCILVQISEGSADAANLSAIYPQKSPPCITVIGYNGLQLWQTEGFFTAEDLASSVKKAWLNLHLQETAASVLTAALATQKTELLVQGNSGYNLPGQGTSSSSDAPLPLTENHIPCQEAQDASTPSNIKTIDEKEHLPVKKVNLKVGDNSSPAPETEPGITHAEQASSSKVNEAPVPVKLEPKNIANDKVPRPPVQETDLANLRLEGKKVTSEVVVSESKSSVQSYDNKNGDRDFSSNKSDVNLNIRLPDFTSLQEKFSLTSTLREVRNYVDEKQEISMSSYDLAIPYPRKVFGNEDLNKTLSELGLLDRQALILVPHSKVGGYPREGSVSRHQTSAMNNIGSSSESSEGYFSIVRRIISYVNPFSYIGGETNPPSSVHESQRSTWQNRPNLTPQNGLGNAGPNQHASSPSDGNRKRPTSSRFGSNIHTLNDEDDDSKTRDRNAFWNGNSTQYNGDSDGK